MWKVVNQTKEFKSFLNNLRKIRMELNQENLKRSK